MSNILELFPYVVQTKKGIEEQNKFLQKISLTGKINTVDESIILFANVDQAIEKFSILEEKLVNALIKETLDKIESELGLNAKLCIDVLKRNLYERTADVGFLSQDKEVISFLEDTNYPFEIIQTRLKEYVKKYSVYDDVIVFDLSGNVKVNINSKNKVSKSKDKILQAALNSDGYVEQFAHSDIFGDKKRSLLYAHKIISSNNQPIGVLVLSFKFDDEMREIFDALKFEDQILTLEDKKEVIASSNPVKIPLYKKLLLKDNKQFKLFKQKYITFSAKTSGYQGYFGLDWQANATLYNNDFSSPKSEAAQNNTILPENLKSIIDEAHEVIDDLSDVIINGEIIASKNKIYTLSPILDNLRNISNMLVQNIDDAATKLAELATTTGLINTVKISTKFAIDVMDRNLYERANDCRWWALNQIFIQELKNESVDSEKLNKVLSSINELYTVYTNIFIYNKNKKIVASSKESSIIGQYLEAECSANTLNSKNTQKYFVSKFEKSSFYANRPTYIYNATIFENDTVLGGIALVFDSETEFKAILQDSFIENKKGFSCFCDKERNVISSTHPDIMPLDKLDIDEKYFQEIKTEILHDFITFKEREYLICLAPSNGYREYKRDDGYKNDIISISFVQM